MGEETTETRSADDGTETPSDATERTAAAADAMDGGGSDSGAGVDRETDPPDSDRPAGIYTGDEITAAVRERSPDGDERAESDAEYARVHSLEREDDGVELVVERFDGTIETIHLETPTDARLEGRLRELFHYLSLEEQDGTALRGELVPVVEGADGVELGDLGIDAPGSNGRDGDPGMPTLSGPLGACQRYDPTLGFLEVLLSASAALCLLLPLLLAGTLAMIGLDAGPILGAVVAQFLVAAILVVRSSILDPQ